MPFQLSERVDLFGMPLMNILNYSRLIFSNCSPQNVSYWMRRASDTDANIIFLMPKERRLGRIYKNTHTLTTMIGITPRGQGSYVSGTFGESASDRHTIERSTLLTDDMFSQSWQVWKLMVQ